MSTQEESLSMSGNQRWSYKKRMQSGKFITCKAPYGYRLINATLVPQEDEAAIVREIYGRMWYGVLTHLL